MRDLEPGDVVRVSPLSNTATRYHSRHVEEHQEAPRRIQVESDATLSEVGRMRKSVLILCCAIVACAADAPQASSAEVRPRIHAVTAFIEIDPGNYMECAPGT